MALPEVTSARASFLKKLRILIFGPPKHGKSFLAATKSQFWQGWDRDSGGLIVLKDLHWIAFDPNALEGLNEQGYDAPITDLSDKVGDALLPTLNDLAKDFRKRLDAQAAAGGLTIEDMTVVVDTISFLDKNIDAFYTGKYEKWDFHRMKLVTHTRFVDMLKALPCTVLVLAHAKAEAAASDATQVAQRLATDLPGSGGISSNIGGQTKGTYEGLVSMILPMLTMKVLDPKHPKKDAAGYVTVRKVFPFGGNGMEGASRYTRYLAKEEPADLTALFNKIRLGVEANWATPGNPIAHMPDPSSNPAAGSNQGAK